MSEIIYFLNISEILNLLIGKVTLEKTLSGDLVLTLHVYCQCAHCINLIISAVQLYIDLIEVMLLLNKLQCAALALTQA